MLTAKGSTADGKELLLLGLSRGNIDRLIAGQPIRMTRESHGEAVPANLEISIVFGETEQAIANALRQSGAVDSATKQYVDPRLNDS